MSLSPNQKDRPTELPPISLGGIASQSASDTAEEPETSPETEGEQQPVSVEEVEDNNEPDAAAQSPASVPTTKAPAEPKKWPGIVLDTLLVTLVVCVLGGGGYYIKKQWDKYRVPTMMELTQEQCLELCAQREALQDAANHADEQLHMRRMLSHLERRLSDFSEKSANLRASISEQQNRVLALQHEIRQTDKENRNVARGLLPGLPVGNVNTKRGRVYANATISRLQGKRISVRTPDGAASFPASELIKDNLPTIVLYALGEIDLVDTTDFTTDGTAPDSSKPANTKLRKINFDNVDSVDKDYAPPGNGPVVDTDANRTNMNGDEGLPDPVPQRSNGDVWQAPSGDLPL